MLPIDQDGDGHSPPDDCDDTSPTVYPGAPEVPYNAVDEDCDGDDLEDVDGDGYPAEMVGGDDCVDANARVHPDAAEECGNGADEDCDGTPDDGCAEERDPYDPGGLSWTCAHAAGGAGGPGLGLVPMLLAAWSLRRVRHTRTR